jgi:hypothetical protein
LDLQSMLEAPFRTRWMNRRLRFPL